MSVQEKIQQLLWDRRYVQIPEEYAPPGVDYVLIKDMTNADRNLYSFVRRKELELARKQGVKTEIELVSDAKVVGLWTAEDELIMSKADEHIAYLQGELKRQKLLSRKKSIQLDIERTEAKKLAVQSKRSEYFINSAEYLASEIAATTLIRRVVFNMDETPMWPTDDSFLYFKHNFPACFIFITNAVLSEGILPIEEIREVARYPEWRLTWVLQRESLHTIFNRNIGDLNINQKLLIYWSRLYDSAYESSEPPSNEVIADDEKFDQWLANRETSHKEASDSKRLGTKDHTERMQLLDGEYSEACNCGSKAKNVGKGLGERLPHTQTCPWGTFRRYTREERDKMAAQVYSRNSDNVRHLIDREQQAVLENGTVEEQHLRGKKTRSMLGMKTDVVSIKKK